MLSLLHESSSPQLRVRTDPTGCSREDTDDGAPVRNRETRTSRFVAGGRGVLRRVLLLLRSDEPGHAYQARFRSPPQRNRLPSPAV